MNIIADDETLLAARAEIADASLSSIIDRIVHDAKASDLWELTCIIVVGAADPIGELKEALGFNPLKGPLGLTEEGEFLPWWNWLGKRDGYFEVLHCVGDFACFVLVAANGHSDLAALCRGHG